jgi:hypothetical protein
MDWPSFPKSDGFIATIASSFTSSSSLESDIVVVVVVARVFILGVLLFPRPTTNRTSPAKHKAHKVDEHEEAPGPGSFFTLNRATKAAAAEKR